MDHYRTKLDRNGPGGIKCKCCGPRKHNKKDRTWSRSTRRILKQETTKQIILDNNL